MDIVYMKRNIVQMCEVQYNIAILKEPHNIERIIHEDDEFVYTKKNKYRRCDLEKWFKTSSNISSW